MLQLRQLFDSLRANAVELSMSSLVITAGTLAAIASDLTLGHNEFIGYVCGFVAAWCATVSIVWALTRMLEYATQVGVTAFFRSHIKR